MSQQHRVRSPRGRPHPALIASFLVPALTALACSKTTPTTTTTTSPTATAPPAATAAATPTVSTSTPTSSPSATASGGLSGSWSGTYSGSFQGTFTLQWQQTGSSLSGTIDLSTGGNQPINGSVQGGAIQFGTVGSQAITYTGTVSGGSMSGSYKVGGAAGAPRAPTRPPEGSRSGGGPPEV